MFLLLPGYCVKQTDSSPGLSKSLSLKQVAVQVFGHFAGTPPWGCTAASPGSQWGPEPVLVPNEFLLAVSPPIAAAHPLLFGGPFSLSLGLFCRS